MNNKDIFKSIVDRSIDEITIPSRINNIGGRIFSGCNNLTRVIIPNSITEFSLYTTFSKFLLLKSILQYNVWRFFFPDDFSAKSLL